jgi:3-hydroxy acid dehydrogenase/malonic semialdehyde reductase
MSLLGRRLDDEVAYITGASSGIGAAIALRLAEAGATVVLGARREKRLHEVKDAIEQAVDGAKVVVLPVDVNNRPDVDSWLERAALEAGPCTILVNNAGGALGADTVAEAKQDDWDGMMDTNVRSVFYLTRKVVPGMIERNRGDIVMIASVAGIDAYPKGSVYCAAKAAVLQFAAVLRKELLGHDIRVLSFNPGLVETEFALVRFAGDAQKASKVYEGMTPLTPEDIADCVGFALTRGRHMYIDRMLILATDQSSATTVHRRS